MINQKQVANVRISGARDYVTIASALAGAVLFLAVPEFGIPVAIAAAGLGAISGLSALTRPKSYTAPPSYTAPEKGKEQ